MLTNLKRKIRRSIYSIKKLWKWIPIIWDDRDWDHWYIFEILKRKLEDVQEYTLKHSHHVNYEDDARKIRTAIKLIQRVQEEYYIQEYYDISNNFSMEEVKKAIAKQDKAKRVLFNYLNHYILNWWD